MIQLENSTQIALLKETIEEAIADYKKAAQVDEFSKSTGYYLGRVSGLRAAICYVGTPEDFEYYQNKIQEMISNPRGES